METQKIRSFRKLLRLFERLTAHQLKEDSCCQGVTLTQCHTILEIEELGQATTVEISKRLGLDKSTLSRTIDGLVNIGLVERSPNPSDRRFTILSLTEHGQHVADQINRSNDDYFGQVFKHVEIDRYDEVIDNFERLVLAMRDHQDSLKETTSYQPIIEKEKAR
ncbi:MAG: MarR family transcriptional regulator [Desulfobacterales bacterium]|nr:MAG: MarR family transcriptional regulator [Desulfobacterales bacterium]UCD91294.1 MAG: MarR family transcriptional regulator [Desulfobacterales bacterium]